jgi:(2Fe-2S) ferredoxin
VEIAMEQRQPESNLEAEKPASRRYVLVCQGLFCQGRGSRAWLTELRRLEQAGELPPDVAVKPYYCFNGCSHGPNIVCYPEKVWFERVSPANFSQVLAYLSDGTAATDPALTQRRVLETVRQCAFTEIEKVLK